MRTEVIRESIELLSTGIEVLAALIIVGAIVHGIEQYALYRVTKVGDAYPLLKEKIGRGLLLGLEFLIAADIIRTVTLDPTFRNMAELGLLVVIRTFLSWSIVVEIEGRWPWKTDVRTNRKE